MSRQTFGGGAISRHYVFDPDGRLLAEHDATTGDVVREYIWVGDTPVAVIDSSSGSPVTYYIHAGQLDEPLTMTDASKAVVWNVRYEPFGKATVFGTPTADMDLRLPGQWLQDETGGLHQNGFRDYDPSLGRYVEADPLGIGGDTNLYAYGSGSPVNLVDSQGFGATGAAWGSSIGGGIIFVGSLYVDAVTGGLNVAATPTEVGLGALLGGALGSFSEDMWNLASSGEFGVPSISFSTAYKPRQAAGVGSFTRADAKTCDCATLYLHIDISVREMQRRNAHLIYDPGNLPRFGPFSVDTHQDQYRREQNRLRWLIFASASRGCFGFRQDAWFWSAKPAAWPRLRL